MSAWETPRSMAINALAEGMAREDAAAAVDQVLRHLKEPDRDMLAAGIRELVDGGSRRKSDREVVAAIWQAMFERAQR